MPYRLELSIPGLPSMQSAQKRPHWTRVHREAKRWREVIGSLTHCKRPTFPLKRARVTLTRRSSREPDFENAAFACKPVVDALVFVGVIEDDRPAVLERDYRWERAPRGKGSLEIVVEEIAA